MRKTKHRGIARVAADFLLNLIAYNLIAFPNCLPLSHPASKPKPGCKITSTPPAPPQSTTGEQYKNSPFQGFSGRLLEATSDWRRDCRRPEHRSVPSIFKPGFFRKSLLLFISDRKNSEWVPPFIGSH